MNIQRTALALALAGALAIMTAAADAAQHLIPRTALFGNPIKAQARLSPNGANISFLAPKDGVLNVWVAASGKLGSARPITSDRKRGIREHLWAQDNRHRSE